MPGSRPARELVVDGRQPGAWTASPGFLARARRCSTRSPPTCRSTPMRSSGRCSPWSGSTPTTTRLDLINSNPYGNGTAIFTNDGGAARRYQNEVEVGMIGINVPVPVPVGYYSFGGWKASLFGDTHAHGTEGFTSTPATRSSPPAGSTPATAASTWASRKTSRPGQPVTSPDLARPARSAAQGTAARQNCSAA